MKEINVLAISELNVSYFQQLQHVFTVHDRIHLRDPQAWLETAKTIRGIAMRGDAKLDAELVEQLPQLEFISVFGVGYDGVDLPMVLNKNIQVAHTPNVLTDDVADLAMGLLIAMARKIPQSHQYVVQGLWDKLGAYPLATKVANRKMGIVGMGRIGQAIARRALGFDMSIFYTSRQTKPNLPYQFIANIIDLAREVDFLVVATPGGKETTGLINAEVLQALGAKSGLINIARGSVVDQPALIKALQTGVIASAALDVYSDEPFVPPALRDLPQVVLTPHIGSATAQTRQAMADLAYQNMYAYFAKLPVPALVPECQ
ncbi:MAG: 2-hydroxyacid dehydrogenase [Gammaproteobacteria bacterium]|nr:2-hydroxyacid dehydrogenase [Gammaproteobacteria bacterium]